MLEGPFFCLFKSVHFISDRTTLHKYNGMVPVLSYRSRGKSIHIFGRYILEYLFETECRNMVTFIHNDHSVVFDGFFNCVSFYQRLHNGNVYNSTQIIFIGS